MNLLDAAYALSIGPHYCYHKFVTGKYGPKVEEKTGKVPDRFKTSETAVMGTGDPHVDSPCLWLHAVSVGEAVAAVDLVRMFREDNPRWDIKVSTTTATGRSVAEKNWGAENVFYYPLDFSGMVKRAFDSIRPSMVVLMELEIWPNFLAEAVRRNTPVVVANARITERSVKRLAWAPGIARNMANAVEEWFAQTDEYAERLKKIGVPACRIEVTGSVKYDAVPLELDNDQAGYYRRLFGCGEKCYADGGDLLVVGGSTHPTEERILLSALREAVGEKGVKPKVVLAPRHPERLDEVEATAREFGQVMRRSKLPEPAPGQDRSDAAADIVLVDTVGELAKIYSAADLVYVGGTFHRHGGQNFLEPCGLAKPTVVGPPLGTFREPADLLGGAGVLTIVQTPEQLTPKLRDFLENHNTWTEKGWAARQLLLQQRGAARRMTDRLNVLAKAVTRKT